MFWNWGVATSLLNEGANEYAYTPDLSTNPLPFGGGGVYAKGREIVVVGVGGINLENDNSAQVEYFTLSNQYFYVMDGGLEFGGEARLPQGWVEDPLPSASGWVPDPGFGGGG